jgi:hypothetical protein
LGTTAAIAADTFTGSRKQSGLSHDCQSSPARLHTTTAGHYFLHFRFLITDLRPGIFLVTLCWDLSTVVTEIFQNIFLEKFRVRDDKRFRR